jgi:hypothetical protein
VLLALRLERGGNGRLQLSERHLTRLVVVKLVEELIEGVTVLVLLLALLRCRHRQGWWWWWQQRRGWWW